MLLEELPPGDTTMILLNQKSRCLPLPPLWTPVLLNKQATQRVTVLAGMIDPAQRGKLDCYSTAQVGRACLGHRRLLAVSQRFLGPLIKNNEKLEKANPIWPTNGPVTSEMKVWVTPSGKNNDQLRCLLEARGIQSGQQKAVTNVSYNHVTSYRNEDVLVMSLNFLFCYEFTCMYK